MFAEQIRKEQEQEDAKVARLDLFSTIAVPSGGTRDMVAFGHSVGQPTPGRPVLIASRAETNMMVASQTVDTPVKVHGFAVRIPAVVPAAWNDQCAPYEVTPEDVQQFFEHAVIGFYIGGDVPWIEMRPKSTRISRVPRTRVVEKANSSWLSQVSERQWPAKDESVLPIYARGLPDKPVAFERAVEMPDLLLINRIEKFWAMLSWTDGPPAFGASHLAVEFWILGAPATMADREAAFAAVERAVGGGVLASSRGPVG